VRANIYNDDKIYGESSTEGARVSPKDAEVSGWSGKPHRERNVETTVSKGERANYADTGEECSSQKE
jgi:hypothetical protein